VQNIGTSVWPALVRPEESDDRLVVIEGVWLRGEERVGPEVRVRLPRDVLPGDRVYVSVSGKAPDEPGDYVLSWRVRQVGGERFSSSPAANAATRVERAAPEPAA